MRTGRAESLVPADPTPYVSALPTHELSWQTLYQAKGSGAGVKVAQQSGLLPIRQKRMVETRFREADEINGVEAHVMRLEVFVAHGRLKHGRIVARQRDRQTAPEKGCERVLLVSGGCASNLSCKSPRTEIARRADF